MPEFVKGETVIISEEKDKKVIGLVLGESNEEYTYWNVAVLTKANKKNVVDMISIGTEHLKPYMIKYSKVIPIEFQPIVPFTSEELEKRSFLKDFRKEVKEYLEQYE